MVLAATDLHVPGGRGATPRLDGVSLTLAPGEVVWTSASKGVNIDRVRDLVRGWLVEGPPAAPGT